jgi:hypothetical protein
VADDRHGADEHQRPAAAVQQPLTYYGKVFFWIKMGLMGLAGVNALVFHYTTYRSVAEWDNDRILPRGARLAGAFGLFLWIGVIVFGRLTPYNWLDYLMAAD